MLLNESVVFTIYYTTFLLDDTKLRFVLDSIYFYQDTSIDSSYFYCDGNSNHNSILDDYIRNNYPERLNALPLHLVNGYYAYAAGYSHNGSVLSFYRTNPDMNTNNVHDYWYHQHLVHEIGHSLDLAHTYSIGSQNCNISNLDFLWDVYDTTATRPCSSLTYCDVCILPKDSLNNNILGGGETNFNSALQIGIMHRSTVLNNQWNYGYGMRDYVTGYNVEPLEVTTNQVWDFSMKMYQDLIVKSGVTLIIKCELQFVPDAKVIIEPGAKLILDGGVLTNENYYNSFWQGIQVYGTSGQHQFPSNQPTHQGMLVLKNGAVIEYAHKAAANWRQNSWNEIGGVIQSTNSVFRNNRRDVVFMAYENFKPGNPSVKFSDHSYFRNTEFISDDNYIEGYSQQDHVSLWGVKGINFTNCHFTNNVTNKIYSNAPKRGIYSVDAGFVVQAGCSTPIPIGQSCPTSDLLQSSFTGLHTAI